MARLASLACLLTLATQLCVESAHSFADLVTRHESVQAVAANDQSNYLPSAGRAEAQASAGKAREQIGERHRLRLTARQLVPSESVFRSINRETHPPRLLLRHRVRSSAGDDLPG